MTSRTVRHFMLGVVIAGTYSLCEYAHPGAVGCSSRGLDRRLWPKNIIPSYVVASCILGPFSQRRCTISVQDGRFREDVSLPRFCPFDFAQGRLRGCRVHRARDKGRSTKDNGEGEGGMAKSGHSSFPLSPLLLSFFAGRSGSWLLVTGH